MANLMSGLNLGEMYNQGMLQQQAKMWAETGNAAPSISYRLDWPMATVKAPLRSGPETALEWLDRRVAEVRVPLAAK